MNRRMLLQGVALSLMPSSALAQQKSMPAPAIRSNQNKVWSVRDFQGQSFRAKLENAVHEAIGSEINIRLPGGSSYDLDAPINVSSQDILRLAITGDGMPVTIIKCDGVGISLNGAAGSQYSFKGMSFLPQRENQGTALKLEWMKATVGKGFAVQDVGFGSNSPDNKNFFAKGLEIRNKGTGQISGCWFNGLPDVDPQGDGLVLAAANDVIVTDTYMYNLAYACRSDGATSLEGFRLHGGTFVRVGHGIYFQADPIGIPYIEVALSHINACYEAIHVEGYAQVNIVDNLFYGRKDVKFGAGQTDVFLRTCPSATISRNKFFSGMEKSKTIKTAIKLTGSIRNSRIADNLVSERTTFLDIYDDGLSGAKDVIISKNRPEVDLKGRSTVSKMYRFTNSNLHERITWEAFDNELSTIGIINRPFDVHAGEWLVVPFTSDQTATSSGIDLRSTKQSGEFIVPAGVTKARIEGRIYLKALHQSSCSLRILVDGRGDFKEVAFGSTFGDEVSVTAETNVIPVNIGSRIRVEVRVGAGGIVDALPERTRVIFTPK